MSKDYKKNRKLIHNYLPQFELHQKGDTISIRLRIPHIGQVIESVPGKYDQPLTEQTVHRNAWRQIVAIINETHRLIHQYDKPEEHQN